MPDRNAERGRKCKRPQLLSHGLPLHTTPQAWAKQEVLSGARYLDMLPMFHNEYIIL